MRKITSTKRGKDIFLITNFSAMHYLLCKKHGQEQSLEKQLECFRKPQVYKIAENGVPLTDLSPISLYLRKLKLEQMLKIPMDYGYDLLENLGFPQTELIDMNEWELLESLSLE